MIDDEKAACRYYAGAFGLHPEATKEEILQAIDQLPANGMVNPEDARRVFKRLLSGDLRLSAISFAEA